MAAKRTDHNLSGSDTNEPDPMHTDDEGELADVELEYRGRGRPRLDPALRRKEKLIISLTVDELRRIMMAGAQDKPMPLSPNDWARRELLRLAPALPEDAKP